MALDTLHPSKGPGFLLKSQNGADIPDKTLFRDNAGITAAIAAAIAGLIDASPAQLDTLNELAAALGDDANYAATIAAQMGERAVKQSSVTDTTAGAGLIVGAFGLGAQWVLTDPDLNNADVPGTYITGSPPTNIPDGWHSATRKVLIVGGGTSYTSQVLVGVTSNDMGRIAVRHRTGQVNPWSEWREVYTQQTIVGTVSQSAGVPTGAIFESGSNANGRYLKYADGTMIIFGRVNGVANATEVTFPASFVDVDYRPFSNCHDTTPPSYAAGNLFTDRMSLYFDGGSVQTISYMCIGRWF